MRIYLQSVPYLRCTPTPPLATSDFSSGLEPPGEFQTPKYKPPLRPNAWEGGVTHTLQKYLGGLGLLICYLVTILRQVLHGLPAVISGSAFQLNILFIRSSEEVMGPCTMAAPYRIVFATTG